MPFTMDNLGTVESGAYAFGATPIRNQRIHSYTTNDTLATVAGANYFNPAASVLQVGDIIMVVAGIGGTVAGEHYAVSANTGTAVTVVAFS